MREKARAEVVAQTARSLRWVGFLMRDFYCGCDPEAVDPTGWSDDWLVVAEALERDGVKALEGTCPVCQALACTGGCPLASARADL